jgi:hypothetical protein
VNKQYIIFGIEIIYWILFVLGTYIIQKDHLRCKKKSFLCGEKNDKYEYELLMEVILSKGRKPGVKWKITLSQFLPVHPFIKNILSCYQYTIADIYY